MVQLQQVFPEDMLLWGDLQAMVVTESEEHHQVMEVMELEEFQEVMAATELGGQVATVVMVVDGRMIREEGELI